MYLGVDSSLSIGRGAVGPDGRIFHDRLVTWENITKDLSVGLRLGKLDIDIKIVKSVTVGKLYICAGTDK